MDYLVEMPDRGLNYLVQTNQLDPKEAAHGSKNLIYERGMMRPPDGFAKLDLTTTGLDGTGNEVTGIFHFRETDGTDHLLATTISHIYRHDVLNSIWVDETDPLKNIATTPYIPVSCVAIQHIDGIRHDDDAAKSYSYHHAIVSDGGNTNIRRWSGKLENTFHDLLGGDDYHTSTGTDDGHRAAQVGYFRSRLFLISPYDYTSSGWVIDRTQVRWPQAGYLQSWTGLGSGYINLLETGGINVWSAPLGDSYIVYQNKGIWTLNWIGGDAVFDPKPYIPDLGLLGPNLLISRNNIHYFMATDFNMYAYYGGTVLKSIGDKIKDQIQSEIEGDYIERCRIGMDRDSRRLWLFIVTTGNKRPTRAYVYDFSNDSWMVRDFTDSIANGYVSGITAVALIGKEQYLTGPTYQQETEVEAVEYQNTQIEERYGDAIRDVSRAITFDLSTGTWEAGGLYYDYTDVGTFDLRDEITVGDILFVSVENGLVGTNLEPADHYYTVYAVEGSSFRIQARHDEDVYSSEFSYGGPREITTGTLVYCSEQTTSMALVHRVAGTNVNDSWANSDVTGRIWFQEASIAWVGWGAANRTVKRDSDDSTVMSLQGDPTLIGLVGVADGSGSTPGDFSHPEGKTDWIFYSTDPDDFGDSDEPETYESNLQVVLTKERMIFGDTSGFVYEMDIDITADDGTTPIMAHYTPVIDLESPDKKKRWGEFVLVAKGDWCMVEYSLDEGNTWTVAKTFDLTDTWKDYHFYVNKTSETIQLRVTNDTDNLPNLITDGSFGMKSRDYTTYDGLWSKDDNWVWSWDVSSDPTAGGEMLLLGTSGGSGDTLSQPIEKLVSGRTYDVSLQWYDNYSNVGGIIPFLGDLSGTEITSSNVDDFTTKTFSLCAGSGAKRILFEYTADPGGLLRFIFLKNIKMYESPTSTHFYVKSMKMLDPEGYDDR